MSGRNVRNRKRTTVWDFLISLGSGLTNLLKIEKIICLIFLYLLGRDLYFTVNLDKGEIYRENIIDAASIFKLLIENDSYKDMIYIAIIVILAIVVLIMIIFKYFLHKIILLLHCFSLIFRYNKHIYDIIKRIHKNLGIF